MVGRVLDQKQPATKVAAIEALRRQRLTSPVIARRLGLPLSTVGEVLRRLGLGRLKRLDPPAPVVRYQRERPGELIHIDTKKLGKIAGGPCGENCGFTARNVPSRLYREVCPCSPVHGTDAATSLHG